MNVALVRGKFLNLFEMQSFAPLRKKCSFTGFSSLTPYHDKFPFPLQRLISPMDFPDFPYKMPILNRMFIDAHYLLGLEEQLRGFDIAHSAETYYHYTMQCLNAKKRGYVKKVIATVLENIVHNNEGIWGRKKFKKRARTELDHMIALTTLTRDVLVKEGASPGKITVIGHGIDTKRFAPDKTHWKRLSAKNPEVVHILFSGRLEEYKGVLDILDAIALLVKQTYTPRLQITFVGEGNAKKTMQQKEKTLGLTPFVSHTSVPYENMPELYKKADIFVAPSKETKTWREQYCTALLEAQSMGLPIVTTRSGGIPENVGDAGLYAKVGDALSIAKELEKFIKDARLRLVYGRKARKRAVSIHDVYHIAKRIYRVYEKVHMT